jgi:hypothetical protein
VVVVEIDNDLISKHTNSKIPILKPTSWSLALSRVEFSRLPEGNRVGEMLAIGRFQVVGTRLKLATAATVTPFLNSFQEIKEKIE